MILTDTSVVVAAYRLLTPRLRQIIVTSQAAVCGVTVAEIQAGARNPADARRCAATLGLFQNVPLPEAIWPTVGQNHAALRASGITVPLPDVVIATAAQENGLELWTYDAHFALMQSILTGRQLFQEPP